MKKDNSEFEPKRPKKNLYTKTQTPGEKCCVNTEAENAEMWISQGMSKISSNHRSSERCMEQIVLQKTSVLTTPRFQTLFPELRRKTFCLWSFVIAALGNKYTWKMANSNHIFNTTWLSL
jgi:hypothetical protein